MVLGTVSPTYTQLPEASEVEIQIQEALVLPSSFSTSSTLRASGPPQCHTGKQTNDPTWGSLMLAVYLCTLVLLPKNEQNQAGERQLDHASC